MDLIKQVKKAKEDFLSGIGVPEKSEFIPDDFQLEAIESVTAGVDTLVVAPTGAGKTYIALQAIAANLGQSCRAIYTTPLKALSNGKYTDLKNKFEPQYQVGLLTGDRKVDTNADVVVATTEIYRNELYRGTTGYSLVILDEVHYIADPQRGAVWEEAIIFTPQDSALLMLSASISNHQQIAAWLESVRKRPCKVVIAKERPVQLRLGFLHPDYGVLPLLDEKERIFKPVADYYGTTKTSGDGMRLSNKSQRPRKFGTSGRKKTRSRGRKK